MNDINVVCEVYGHDDNPCGRCGHKGALECIEYGQSIRYQAMAQQNVQSMDKDSALKVLQGDFGRALGGLGTIGKHLTGGLNV